MRSLSVVEKQTNIIRNNRDFIMYACISVTVTVLDVLIVWLLKNRLNVSIVTANTVGVITGSVLQYFLISKHVFFVDYGMPGFLAFFGTFLLGLLLSDCIIWLFSEIILKDLHNDINLLTSKLISGIIPFFIIYEIRRYLFSRLKKKNEET